MATTTPGRSRIFISYRHEDTDVAAGRLADDLRKHFTREQVFQDFASIEPGTDFTVAVQHGLDACAAVLVIIGPRWLTAADRQGRRRLDLPDDWVAHEVAESLRRPEVRVFPVLVDADMPSPEELPEPLRPLTRRQAFPVTSRHWPNDVGDLIAFLKAVPGLGGTSAPGAGTSEAPAVRAAEPAPQTAEPRRPLPVSHSQSRSPEHEASTQAVSSPTTTETRGQPENPPSHPLTAPEPDVGGVGQAPRVPWKALAAVGLALGIVVLVFWSFLPKRPVDGSITTPDLKPAPAQPRPTAPTPKVGKSFRDCDLCPEMVVIPAGTFLMGSPETEEGRRPEEGPQHRVTLAHALEVGKFEVTFEEWGACVADGGCGHKPGDMGWGRGRQPVIGVTWEDARTYVSWLAKKTGKPYRLLSEAEWEYAARGGTTTRYPWGDDAGSNRANYRGSGSKWSDQGSAPVGSFEPNRFGLHDMIGNVGEWVQDCMHDTYDGAPLDGSAWESSDCTRRVVRGGSYNRPDWVVRAACRVGGGPGSLGSALGFRVVVSPFFSGL